MNALNRLFKKERNEYLAIALMLAFMVTDAKVPKVLANLVDTLVGRVVVIAAAVSLLFVHHALGVVALVFAYELIRRSEQSTGTYQMRHYLPGLEKTTTHLTAMNQFPVTLEEQMVSKMVPVVNDGPLTTSKFKPVMDNLHQAAKL